MCISAEDRDGLDFKQVVRLNVRLHADLGAGRATWPAKNAIRLPGSATTIRLYPRGACGAGGLRLVRGT